MAKDNVQKLADVLRSLDCVMLTTLDKSGHLVSRPMALGVDQFDGILSLFAPLNSRTIANVTAKPKVSISSTGPTTQLSIAGTATFTSDAERVSAEWHRNLDRWFPRGKLGAALIEITVEEARFWTSASQERSPLPAHGGMRQVDVTELV